jgi:FKBP-type peptidyl-prolyl cis-trans isomerase
MHSSIASSSIRLRLLSLMIPLLPFAMMGVTDAWESRPTPTTNLQSSLSRRSLLEQSSSWAGAGVIALGFPTACFAATTTELDPRAIIKVRLASPNDRLGVELVTTSLRGKNVVVVQRVVSPAASANKIQPGMILLGFDEAKAVVERLQSGPFPFDLQFFNLAAGGDAFSDVGTPMVTAQDAFNLAKQTDDQTSSSNTSTATIAPQYSIATLSSSSGGAGQSSCAIQSRRGDVLEIHYQATALLSDGRRYVYDSSASRGTGQPYQMVLGSGDMIPGVDQGVYDMCPGDVRLVQIPPRLAYGGRGSRLYQIPPETPLEWRIELVSIDSTIRQNNNDQTREEREGRAFY